MQRVSAIITNNAAVAAGPHSKEELLEETPPSKEIEELQASSQL
ncbi:MAG: hypothetical protein ACLS8R_08490 [Anaeromassilibacillus sp.]